MCAIRKNLAWKSVRFLFPTIISALLLLSCKPAPPREGFNRLNRNIWFRLCQIGESEKRIQSGDYVQADISCRTIRDSLILEGYRKFHLSGQDSPREIQKCISILREGDSAEFILPAALFFQKNLKTSLQDNVKPDDFIIFSVKILNIQTSSEYEAEKTAFLHWMEGFSSYEKYQLTRFLQEQHINAPPSKEGFYHVPIRSGNGKKISRGDTLTIQYAGRFIDGKFFDSTLDHGEPFQFVLGQEGQVLPGFEKALEYMEEGEKALIILPSRLAFGAEGSSTGIIPPYTSLVYEIEVLKVNPGNLTK